MWKPLNNVVILVIVLFSLLLLCCEESPKKDSVERKLPYIVSFEQCMETEQAMKISDIADTVEYIELKSPKDVPITRVWDIIPVDDFWIIHALNSVYKFTNKGEYIKTIGRHGQGPGEFSGVFNIDVDRLRREIVISDFGKTLYYDLDGNYLRTDKLGTLFRIGISDSILWVSELGDYEYKYTAFALNYQRDTVFSIPSPFYGIEPQDGGAGLHLAKLYKPFYRYKDTLYLKGREYNDTIYQLSGIKCKPYAIFDMGKYKLPMEYEAWYNYEAAQKNGSRYWGIVSVAEDVRYSFLLAQRYAAVDGNKYVHNEDNFRYIVYDKEKRKGFVTNGEQGTRFTDDILGGPAIWPYWVIGDYYMNVIEWDELSNEIEKGNYKLAPAFEKQLAGYGYDTNPLVVMCRRKK